MKAINITNGIVKSKESQKAVVMQDLTDRQPCWYANFEFDGDDREEASWHVGLKDSKDNSSEYSFKVNKAGDVEDEKFWKYTTSAEFAIKLLDLFKKGGESTVKQWVKQGCPR